MYRTGIASLPLHYGKAPTWLTARMTKLAREIASIVIDEYNPSEFLARISDPFWFQALGCVLGYDWHSSGVTTVVTGVLKRALTPDEHGIAVCGGKGKASRNTPSEIASAGDKLTLSSDTIDSLQYASRMSAKVDNAAIQAGYQLYHHTLVITEKREWAVIQQGMCAEDRTARRYHWLSKRIHSFVIEPHNAIVGNAKRNTVLDMTAMESEGARRVSVDVARERPERIKRMIIPCDLGKQKSLQGWMPDTGQKNLIGNLHMPRRINWKTLKEVYEFQPNNYEELLSLRGVGPATVRGLALIAELIYGEKPSWKDPVKYSYAYGGKDGVPYPVDRKAMDESIQMLEQAVQEAKLGDREKVQSLRRLAQFAPKTISP